MTIAEDRIQLEADNRSLLTALIAALPPGELKTALEALLADPTKTNADIAHAYWIGTGTNPSGPA